MIVCSLASDDSANLVMAWCHFYPRLPPSPLSYIPGRGRKSFDTEDKGGTGQSKNFYHKGLLGPAKTLTKEDTAKALTTGDTGYRTSQARI